MTNEEYLSELDDGAIRDIALEVMATYGDNRWWLSEDPREVAYFQIQQPIFLCRNFSQFHEGIEKLLGRPVFTHEMAVNWDGLTEEAKQAWEGTLTDERRSQGIESGFKKLVEMRKRIIVVSPDGDTNV